MRAAPSLPFPLDEFGGRECDFQRLLSVETRIAIRVIAVVQVGIRERAGEFELMIGHPPALPGENLLRLLESRFDNVLVRLGFAASRRQARQLINHGHWLINGRRVDIPSYQVRPEDIISIKPTSSAADTVRRATELVSTVPAWLQADHDALTAKVLRYPERSEISAPVQEQLIVELYSK